MSLGEDRLGTDHLRENRAGRGGRCRAVSAGVPLLDASHDAVRDALGISEDHIGSSEHDACAVPGHEEHPARQ